MEAKHQHTIYPIHRLDRETSGTLLLGKNPKINAYFTDLFETTQVHKCYFLIGIKKQESIPEKFTANERLSSPDHGEKIMQVQFYPENSIDGKASKTEFNILYQNEKYVLGLAFPHTGRQHQIRVHAMAHGFPLLGDKIYLGGYSMFERFKDYEATSDDCELLQLPRQALHALAITMMYKEKETTFISPLPLDLQHWIKKNIPDLNFATFFKTIEEYAKKGTKL
jgi:23S rRNA-/tRNA-specific pseudouridylate synthase